MEVLHPIAAQSSDTLHRQRRHFEAGLNTLQRHLSKICVQSALPEMDPPAADEHLTEEPRYVTGFGDMTFTELYGQTSRIVGSLLYDQQPDFSPEDIDDCLQVAYLKLWQKLQCHPDFLAGKPKRYIVKALLFGCKAQRYAHHRHNRKQDFVDQPISSTVSPFLTTAEVDTWLDIQQALHRVGNQLACLDTPAPLLALYGLLTDIPAGEISQLYRTGYSTLIAARRQVKATLALAMPGYGQPAEPQQALFVPRKVAQNVSYPKVTRWLCDRREHHAFAG